MQSLPGNYIKTKIKSKGGKQMITLAEWKIIGITLIATFFISAIVYGIMCEIVAKMKNKARKRTSKQVTCQRHKNTFSIDYDKFINENFEKITYLYENKNRKSELVRMIG